MTRKQMTELSIDQLRMLRWKILSTPAQDKSHCSKLRRQLMHVQHELHIQNLKK